MVLFVQPSCPTYGQLKYVSNNVSTRFSTHHAVHTKTNTRVHLVMSNNNNKKKVDKLPPKPGFTKPDGPVALIVMDGIGLAPPTEWNAVTQAYTPFLNDLLRGIGPGNTKAHFCELDASGMSVGLPSMKDMGNSEVGHNALGAGRVFDQGAKLVNNEITSGNFQYSNTWKWLMQINTKQTFHMIGLLSDGNIHAHINHVLQMIDQACDDGIKRIRVHTILDGRDVPEKSALHYIQILEDKLKEVRVKGCDARIASGGGRMIITMDRYEANWNMVDLGWKTHCLGDTTNIASFSSAQHAIEYFYTSDPNLVDQYMPPFIVADENGEAVGKIIDGDSVLFWNFRGDRSIEISQAFENEQLNGFDREYIPQVKYAGMMQYDGDANIPQHYLVAPPSIDGTVGEYIVANGMKRYSISETQKYGHVTYFFNGNRSSKFNDDLEKYTCIPSYKQREDTRPWMKAAEISDEVIKELSDFQPDFMVINYPNGDMVGHTGNMNASRISVEVVDLCLSRIIPEIIKHNGIVLLTADHGNCDVMAETDKNGIPKPGNQPEGWKAKVSHTNMRVPLIIVGNDLDKYEIDPSVKWSSTNEKAKYAGIANIASTVLNLLGLEHPDDYLPSLIKLKSNVKTNHPTMDFLSSSSSSVLESSSL